MPPARTRSTTGSPCSTARATTRCGAKKLANALRTAAGRAGWGAAELPKNSGIGIACVSSQERATATWTACAAEVEVNPTNGAFEVKKPDRRHGPRHGGQSRRREGADRGLGAVGHVAGAVREGAAQERRAAGHQLRRLHADADERDAGPRHLDHRQQRPALGLRRARASRWWRRRSPTRSSTRSACGCASLPITQAAVRKELQAKKT